MQQPSVRKLQQKEIKLSWTCSPVEQLPLIKVAQTKSRHMFVLFRRRRGGLLLNARAPDFIVRGGGGHARCRLCNCLVALA